MVVYGKQTCLYILQNRPDIIQSVYLSKDIDKKIFSSIAKINKKIIRIDNKKAQSLAQGRNHQGIFFDITPLYIYSLSDIIESNKILVLSDVMDIGNIGQIIRSAYCLGIDCIILADRDGISIEVLQGIFRASSGALLNVKLAFARKALDILNELKLANFQLIRSDVDSKNISNFRLQDKWALFIGNEEKGLKKRLKDKISNIISVPMDNNFNSLNVGVATGIMIYMLNKGYLNE